MAPVLRRASERVESEEVRSPIELGDVRLSDPQEFVFLPPRQGRTWSADLVEARIRDVREQILEQESRDGDGQHKLGTMLRELYAGFAERVKGRSSFADFAAFEFDLSRAQVYRLLRLAAAATQAQARSYGVSRCLLGLRLLELTGLQSLEALSHKPLKVETGDEIFFTPGVPKRQLESAVRVLAEKQAAAERAALPRRTASEVQRLNREVARLMEDDPALQGAKVRYAVSRDGRATLRVQLGDLEQRKAFARVLPKLLRLESP